MTILVHFLFKTRPDEGSRLCHVSNNLISREQLTFHLNVISYKLGVW